ncbi:protein sym1-like [Homalodisca vitripennis]|uniref:protein sym1-like n=1 Tax=Homalodisca vitripennis TaxID=197043 RepID=UPI001EEA3341|nr:protein sym1-like [Homalodisca vitripennis]
MAQFSKFAQFFSLKHPLSRGMISYALIWPAGSLIQQTIAGEEKYDFIKAARYSLWGSCYVAPALHTWYTIANRIWPHINLKSVLAKVVAEQLTFSPFAMSCFLIGMTLLEGKAIQDAKNELEAKFISTYKTGVCVWPAIQTFNYMVIKEKNRVVFMSFCSLLWTVFLAYVKQQELQSTTVADPVSSPQSITKDPLLKEINAAGR